MIPFRVPRLCERPEDIPILARSFLEEFCAESGLKAKRITRGAMKRLRQQLWPGNVRELRNLMERLVIMTPRVAIDADDIPETAPAGALSGAASVATLEEARRRFEGEYLRGKLREHRWNISRTAQAIGLARESLSRKLKAHGIEVKRDPD